MTKIVRLRITAVTDERAKAARIVRIGFCLGQMSNAESLKEVEAAFNGHQNDQCSRSRFSTRKNADSAERTRDVIR